MTQCDLRVELMFSSSAIIMAVQSFEVQFIWACVCVCVHILISGAEYYYRAYM